MIKNQKPIWLPKAIIVFALLLNVIIIKTAYTDNQNLFWIFIVSIPLLIIAIYNEWQTNHLLRKYFTDNLQSPASQSHLELLFALYHRVLARLIAIATQVEQHLEAGDFLGAAGVQTLTGAQVASNVSGVPPAPTGLTAATNMRRAAMDHHERRFAKDPGRSPDRGRA
jgi:hypothetical protein